MSVNGSIDIEGVSIVLGRDDRAFEAVRNITFRVTPGEFVCVLGRSGCGKSTLLAALAGHVRPANGSLRVDGQPVDGPGPERGLVFQQHTLLPWKTVEENVAFGLKMKGVPLRQRLAWSQELLQSMKLADFAQHYPFQLSGGMQQRVEIARVLINRPRVLLMDEPFGALDALTRVDMQELLLMMWTRFQTTVVFVTHDIDEALFLADRILVMGERPGRIVEDLPLRFPRPRHADLLTDWEFVTLKRHCLNLLHHEHADDLGFSADVGSPGSHERERLMTAKSSGAR
jgi:NitT/TauT family transport system ATP-binding protein